MPYYSFYKSVVSAVCSGRIVILEMSMAGSRFMAMYSVLPLIVCCSRHWLALATTSRLYRSAQLYLPSSASSTPS